MDFSNGQTVYVPAYSQIHSVYSSTEESRINIAVTLSIRNTDIDNPIFIKSVSYYGDDGTLLKEYVEAPFQISKMASVSFKISQADISGGIGANFIVEWGANQSVNLIFRRLCLELRAPMDFHGEIPVMLLKKSVIDII